MAKRFEADFLAAWRQPEEANGQTVGHAPRETKGVRGRRPAGPHTPISNIITEGERVRTSRIYQPESGSAQGMVDLSKLEKQATRELGARVAAASIQVPRAAKDVGRASFRDPEVVLETVHGKDDRVQVQDTDKFPHCAVASLLITARDGSQ